MIVAEIVVTLNGGFAPSHHKVAFSDLALAKSEYERVAGLMKKHYERNNDLDDVIELDGGANKGSFPLRQLSAVGLVDFAHSNAEMAGVKDTFPNLFKV